MARYKGYTLTFSAKRAAMRTKEHLSKAMAKVVPKLEKRIKKITPISTERTRPGGPHGDLMRSVSVKAVTRTKNPRIEVRCIYYGRFVEHGTYKMTAQPFMTPIIKGERDRWEREVAMEAKRLGGRYRKRASRRRR